MDWFENICGFREESYEKTQARLSVKDGQLRSTTSSRRFSVGELEMPSLAELRSRVVALQHANGVNLLNCIAGDARALHAQPANCGALFQVASQFNLLEMAGPSVTPEHGVTGYAGDRTQGPACAIAAGAGTIYRNYLVEIGGGRGQRAHRQIDCLSLVGQALDNSGSRLWEMRNGYALCTAEGLKEIDDHLRFATAERLDELRTKLQIGLHWDVAVTDSEDPKQLVSQAYCSALPVAYSSLPKAQWQRFASLVLEAAYEATLLAGVLNKARGGSNRVLLTRLGGGAFGNDFAWINAAMMRAIKLVENRGLDIQIVCYGAIPSDVRDLVTDFNRQPR